MNTKFTVLDWRVRQIKNGHIYILCQIVEIVIKELSNRVQNMSESLTKNDFIYIIRNIHLLR